MRPRFDQQLEELNLELIKMGSLCERGIRKAVDLLMEENTNASIKDVDIIEEEINQKERDIETLCMRLLLQQQPVAKDLRRISAALKMITDMERIGDHAVDISELTIVMSGKPYMKKLEHIEQMAKETMIMLISSLEAYVNKNLDQAKEVIDHDDIVDDLFIKVKTELIQLIRENAENGEQAADLLMVAKYFERIGDHILNIGQEISLGAVGD